MKTHQNKGGRPRKTAGDWDVKCCYLLYCDGVPVRRIAEFTGKGVSTVWRLIGIARDDDDGPPLAKRLNDPPGGPYGSDVGLRPWDN